MLLTKTLRSSTLKLALIYVTVFSAAIFAILGYVYWSTVSYLSETTDRSIAREAVVLSDTYADTGRNGLVALADRLAARDDPDGWVYLLTDAAQRKLAGNLENRPRLPAGREGWVVFMAPKRGVAAGETRFRATWRVLGDGLHLLVGRRADDVGRFGHNIARGLLWAAGLFLAMAAAAGISTSRRSVARIEAINATSREIIETGLKERIPVRGTGDEWDGLAQNLNSMLDRIEHLVEANRQVSDNIAHDLRTPLTRMRGRLESAYGRRLEAGQYHALIGVAIAELDEILRTFSSLLRIARLESRERMAGFGAIDLGRVAGEVTELYEPAAEQNAVALRLAAPRPVVVIGDRDLLFDAIANLVDNAIKHGGKGPVEVAARAGRDAAVLSVADNGPGIPAAERRHVLRRFYRLERSRSSPGNGLGLSLVAAVANLHGAAIEMADNAPGLKIELHFPRFAGEPAGAAAAGEAAADRPPHELQNIVQT